MSTIDVDSYTLESLSDPFLFYQHAAGTLDLNVWPEHLHLPVICGFFLLQMRSTSAHWKKSTCWGYMAFCLFTFSKIHYFPATLKQQGDLCPIVITAHSLHCSSCCVSYQTRKWSQIPGCNFQSHPTDTWHSSGCTHMWMRREMADSCTSYCSLYLKYPAKLLTLWTEKLCPECLFSTVMQLESEPAEQDCSPAPTEAEMVWSG